MSHTYILSVLTIAHHNMIAHRRRQLQIIQEAYDNCKDIPSERWGAKLLDPDFNRTSLFGHYAKFKGGGTMTVNSALVYCAPLRAALNDFTTCEHEIGNVLEGLIQGPVPMADQNVGIPDYKLIAMSLLRAILSQYPAPTHSTSHGRRVSSRRFDDIRVPYKD